MRIPTYGSLAAGVAIVALAVSMALLPGCSTLPRVVGAETAEKVESTALKAAKTALIVWSYTQDGVLIYGHMPNCDPENPDLKFCKSKSVWAKVKEIEGQVTAKVLAARPLVEAGTDDVAFLMGVAAAVNQGIIDINEAKGLVK